MKRLLLYALKLAILIAIAVWLADRPGHVQIQWQGRVIDTSVAVLVVIAAGLMLLTAWLYRFWRSLRRAPSRFVEGRRFVRREKGYRALTRGMVAVAAGDAEAARRFARKADVLLDEPPLTLLLSAQAAQLAGDDGAATRYFEAMLRRPDMEFLGLRGLLNQSLRSQDSAHALEMAQRARSLRPDATWTHRACFDLEVAQHRWADAQLSLAHAVRVKAISVEDGRRFKTRILVERSREAEAANSLAPALDFAHKAVGLEPDFVPAALQESALLVKTGRDAQAARLLEKSWARLPHPEVARAYAALGPDDEGSLLKVKRLEKLVRLRPEAATGLLTLAEAELAAQLWGSARGHLLKAEQLAPTRRGYRLLADLETAERNDPIAARSWLAKAQTAAPDEAWDCDACGARTDRWSALCGHCHGFDTLAWRIPGPARGLPPVAVEIDALLPVPVPATGSGAVVPATTG
jgi:HemY protein